MLLLLAVLLTGMRKEGELFPTLPTSLLTGYTSSSPSNGCRSDCNSLLHSVRRGFSQVRMASDPFSNMTGMRLWRKASCLFESVVMMV